MNPREMPDISAIAELNMPQYRETGTQGGRVSFELSLPYRCTDKLVTPARHGICGGRDLFYMREGSMDEGFARDLAQGYMRYTRGQHDVTIDTVTTALYAAAQPPLDAGAPLNALKATGSYDPSAPAPAPVARSLFG